MKLKLIIAGIVVLVPVLVVAFFVVSGDDDLTEADSELFPLGSWQINSQIKQELIGLDFTCERITYSDPKLSPFTHTYSTVRLAALGVADAESEFCTDADPYGAILVGLPEEFDSSLEVKAYVICEIIPRTGGEVLPSLFNTFLVDGLSYSVNSDSSSSDILQGILDEQGIDYTKTQRTLGDCGEN